MQKQNLYTEGTGKFYWHVKISRVSHTQTLGSSAASPGWNSVKWLPQWTVGREGAAHTQLCMFGYLCVTKGSKAVLSSLHPAHSTFPCTHSPPALPRSVSRHWHRTEGAGTRCSVTPQPSRAPCPILAAGWDGSMLSSSPPNQPGIAAARMEIKPNMPCPTHTLIV